MSHDGSEQQGVEIDIATLSGDALRGVVEEFVSRDGTDYGRSEKSLEEKCEDVLAQLETGDARIVFDPETESVNVVMKRELRGSA